MQPSCHTEDSDQGQLLEARVAASVETSARRNHTADAVAIVCGSASGNAVPMIASLAQRIDHMVNRHPKDGREAAAKPCGQEIVYLR